MKLYTGVKQGMYDHGLVGIFDSIEKCEAAIIEVLKHQIDDYHLFRLEEYELNEVTDCDRFLNDGKILFRYDPDSTTGTITKATNKDEVVGMFQLKVRDRVEIKVEDLNIGVGDLL